MFDHYGLKVTAPVSRYELWRTGDELSNCIGPDCFADRIERRETLLVAARRSKDGKACFAVELNLDHATGKLITVQAKSYANSPIPPVYRAVPPLIESHFSSVWLDYMQGTPEHVPSRNALEELFRRPLPDIAIGLDEQL